MDRSRSSIDSRRSLLFPSTPEPRERSSLKKPWPKKSLNIANSPFNSVHDDTGGDSPVLGYFTPKTARGVHPQTSSPPSGHHPRTSISHSTSRSSVSVDLADQSLELSPESLWTFDSALGFARRRVIKRVDSDEVVLDINGTVRIFGLLYAPCLF